LLICWRKIPGRADDGKGDVGFLRLVGEGLLPDAPLTRSSISCWSARLRSRCMLLSHKSIRAPRDPPAVTLI